MSVRVKTSKKVGASPAAVKGALMAATPGVEEIRSGTPAAGLGVLEVIEDVVPELDPAPLLADDEEGWDGDIDDLDQTAEADTAWTDDAGDEMDAKSIEPTYTISMHNGQAIFMPPAWAAPYVSNNDLGKRLAFYDELANWISQHRPGFTKSLTLLDWAPAKLEDAIQMLGDTPPSLNCTQQGMNSLLAVANQRNPLDKGTFSRYIKHCALVLNGAHYMPIADLFGSVAQAAWIISGAQQFMTKHGLAPNALLVACRSLATKRLQDQQIATTFECMTLEDFILYARMPVAKTVSIDSLTKAVLALVGETS
ncbi:MAG: hypothetical protein WCL44_14220 [bacterium]